LLEAHKAEVERLKATNKALSGVADGLEAEVDRLRSVVYHPGRPLNGGTDEYWTHREEVLGDE
jgi:hypothetical protein